MRCPGWTVVIEHGAADKHQQILKSCFHESSLELIHLSARASLFIDLW